MRKAYLAFAFCLVQTGIATQGTAQSNGYAPVPTIYNYPTAPVQNNTNNPATLQMQPATSGVYPILPASSLSTNQGRRVKVVNPVPHRTQSLSSHVVTSPDSDKVVDELKFYSQVYEYERRGDWVRISPEGHSEKWIPASELK